MNKWILFIIGNLFPVQADVLHKFLPQKSQNIQHFRCQAGSPINDMPSLLYIHRLFRFLWNLPNLSLGSLCNLQIHIYWKHGSVIGQLSANIGHYWNILCLYKARCNAKHTQLVEKLSHLKMTPFLKSRLESKFKVTDMF